MAGRLARSGHCLLGLPNRAIVGRAVLMALRPMRMSRLVSNRQPTFPPGPSAGYAPSVTTFQFPCVPSESQAVDGPGGQTRATARRFRYGVL